MNDDATPPATDPAPTPQPAPPARQPTRNPQQKTFFTDRIFVIYSPDDYRQFVRGHAEPYRQGSALTREQTLAANEGLEAWATVLIYRSHLEMFGFRQRWFGLFDADGAFLKQIYPINPLNSTAERQAIAMQLAVEAMTRRSEIRSRIDENPYYARLIYDTFYYIDTRHEAGREVTLEAEDLGRYLRQMSDTIDSPDPGELLGKGTLLGYLRNYVRLLADPALLQREVLAHARSLRPEAARIRRRLADCIEAEPLVRIIAETAPPTATPPDKAGTVPIEKSPAADRPFRFVFTSDRYGFREQRTRFDLVAAVQRLRDWSALIGEAFGDRSRAWELASEAALTAREPNWPDIARLIEDAERLLGPFRPPAYETVQPGILKEVPAPVEQPPDSFEVANLTDRVLRAFRGLSRFAHAFELGFLFAMFGSLAVPGDPQMGKDEDKAQIENRRAARRMTGLRAVSRLLRGQASEGADLVLAALQNISGLEPAKQPPSLSVGDPAGASDAASWLDNVLLDAQTGKQIDFAQDLPTFAAWIERLRKLMLQTESSHALPSDLSKAYWAQWFERGGVLRRVGPTAKAATPTALDILHAAAHSGVPLVPGDAIPLSIADLARIRALSKAQALPEIAPFAEFAFDMLAFGGSPDGRALRRERRPAVLISPLSADSPSWSWKPEPGLPASALMPPDALGTIPIEPADELVLFDEIAAAAADRNRGEILRMAAIEVDETGHARIPALRRRAFFGYGGQPPGANPFARAPYGLAPLLDMTRLAAPEFFATQPSKLTAWLKRLVPPWFRRTGSGEDDDPPLSGGD